MINILTGPWGVVSTTTEELSAIGVVLAVGHGLTMLIVCAEPRWAREN